MSQRIGRGRCPEDPVQITKDLRRKMFFALYSHEDVLLRPTGSIDIDLEALASQSIEGKRHQLRNWTDQLLSRGIDIHNIIPESRVR